MFVCGAAATTDDIHQSFFEEGAHVLCHAFRRLVVLSELVWESGVGVSTYK